MARCGCNTTGAGNIVDPISETAYETEGTSTLVPNYGPTVINGISGAEPAGTNGTTSGVTVTVVGLNSFTIEAV